MRGLFVTGTDTGVGKTIVAAAICAALANRGEVVAAFKPAVTGLDEDPAGWPHDHELLAAAASAGQAPESVAPYRFGPAVSPHYATELTEELIEPARLVAEAGAVAAASEALIVEGVGGLLVPLTPGYLVRDFAVDLGLPVVVVARTGLGTLNHTLLTAEAARVSGLRVLGIVLTPWPAEPEPIEVSNRRTLERLAGVPVSGLPPTTPDSLAEAGAALPIDSWF